MDINNIGLLLINSINKNNPENKNKFIKVIKNYNDIKEEKHNQLLEDISYYISKYENKRDQNKTLYEEYIQKRFNLYKKWKDSKNKVNLENLFKLKQPNYDDIPDIYTKTRPKNKLK